MVVFLFPGQGSQQPGMGAAWRDHPSFELVDEASDVLGRDMAWLLLEADAETLQITRNTQVATLLMSAIALDAIERLGIAPQLAAGHSLGEYAALVAAGGISLEAGLLLVQERGDAMAQAAEASPGAMIALLGATLDQALQLVDAIGPDLWLANHNSDTQIVLSGTTDAVASAEELAREYGIRRVTRLKVGGAFHSPYMLEAKDRLRKAIAQTKFYDLEVPVIANVDAREHVLASEWPTLLAEQLTSPVRWAETMSAIAAARPALIVEVGPGGVLANLAKRAIADIPTIAVATPDDLETLVERLAGDGPVAEWATSHQGERLYGSERLIVAPVTGVFQPARPAPEPGAPVRVGTEVGTIGDTPVRSAFAGTLKEMLAVPGERVTAGQPVAWLSETSASDHAPAAIATSTKAGKSHYGSTDHRGRPGRPGSGRHQRRFRGLSRHL